MAFYHNIPLNFWLPCDLLPFLYKSVLFIESSLASAIYSWLAEAAQGTHAWHVLFISYDIAVFIEHSTTFKEFYYIMKLFLNHDIFIKQKVGS